MFSLKLRRLYENLSICMFLGVLHINFRPLHDRKLGFYVWNQKNSLEIFQFSQKLHRRRGSGNVLHFLLYPFFFVILHNCSSLEPLVRVFSCSGKAWLSLYTTMSLGFSSEIYDLPTKFWRFHGYRKPKFMVVRRSNQAFPEQLGTPTSNLRFKKLCGASSHEICRVLKTTRKF